MGIKNLVSNAFSPPLIISPGFARGVDWYIQDAIKFSWNATKVILEATVSIGI